MSDKLQKLIEKSRNVRMSESEKEAQRRSFAYGNANIENDRVTKKVIDEAAERIARRS